MGQDLAAIGAGGIGFLQELEAAIGVVQPDQAVGNRFGIADLWQVAGRVERAAAPVAQPTQKLRQPAAKRIQNRLQRVDARADRVTLDHRNGRMRHARADREFAHAELPTLAQGFQVFADLGHYICQWMVIMVKFYCMDRYWLERIVSIPLQPPRRFPPLR